jgi:hypothetical protein
MAVEAFPAVPFWDPEQRQHKRIQVVECKCGASERLLVTTDRAMPPEVITKKMQARGWSIAARRADDRCPACSHKSHKEVKTMNKPALNVVSAKTEDRTPGRDEKRLIVLAVEDHYLGPDKGYEPGWSDEKIAIDLGVPRKWVSDLREEFHGPELDPEVSTMMAEMKFIGAKLLEADTTLSELRNKFNGLKERLSKKGLLK